MSKNIIYWFSGTGNSLWIARKLAELIGGDVALYSIAATFRGKPMEPSKVIGVVFPVYVLGLPKIVSEFLKAVPATEDTYFFSVANMEGVCGAANLLVQQILNKRGIRLAAGFAVNMPGNYPPLSRKYTIEKVDAILKEAEEKIKDFIVPAINARKHNIMENSSFPIRIAGMLLNKLCRKKIGSIARRFSVDETCTKCGICEKVCPVENITRPAGTPVWHNKCESCMACLQWCPVGAIHMPTPLRKLPRYHNPTISPSELYVEDVIKDKDGSPL